MTDRLHDHTTIGFRRGCVACAQVEADHAMSARAYWAKVRKSFPETHLNPAHPESGAARIGDPPHRSAAQSGVSQTA